MHIPSWKLLADFLLVGKQAIAFGGNVYPVREVRQS